MKLLLLMASMAAVSVCFCARSALADTALDDIKFDAGGSAFAGFGGFVADDAAPGEAAWRRDPASVPVYLLARLSAERDLDDGGSAGIFVRVKPYESPGNRTDVLPDSNEIVKDAYLRLVTTSWGEFRLGYQADVRANEAYYAPQICDCLDGFFGTNSPEVTFDHGPVPENSTAADFDGRAPKIAWYSPSEDGFRFSASYAPERSMGRRIDGRLDELGQVYTAPDRAEIADLKDDRLDEFWSAALAWSGTADEIGLGAEAGISGAKQDGTLVVPGRNDASPLVWDAGVSASYAAWKIGAAYEQQNFIDLEGVYGASAYQPASGNGFLPPATNGIVTKTLDLGVSYTIGPVTLGAAWSRGYYEGLVDAASPKIAATNDVVFGGGQYQVTQQIAVLAGLQFNQYTPEGSGNHPLPRTAALDQVYGGSDPTLNIWDRRYTGIALILGMAARF